MALVENIQREDLDAIEVALTYQRLLEEIGLTQENLSSRVGKERSKFKIGDKVRCIEAAQGQWLVVGEIYTVKKCKYWGYVQLEEIAERHSYHESRFELVSEKLNLITEK